MPAKLTDEQRKGLNPEYFSESGIDPDELGKPFGFASGEHLIERLVELERGRRESGLSGDEYFYKLVDEEIKRQMELSVS